MIELDNQFVALTNDELMEIEGGGVVAGIVIGVAVSVAVVYGAGYLDGINRAKAKRRGY